MKLIMRREFPTLYDGFFLYRVQLLVLPKSEALNLFSIVLMNSQVYHFIMPRLGKRSTKVASRFSVAVFSASLM